MVRGGRGGEVRLKLYLCLVLVATTPPYDIRNHIPAWTWAEMLGLPDPEVKGARRVADALNWLDANKLIKLARRPGSPPLVTLLSPDGTGTKHVRPTTRYVQVPLGFWERQWITTLSGTGVALLLILMDAQSGRGAPSEAPWLSGEQRSRYGLSGDTWTRATRELRDVGLLTTSRTPQGQDFDWRRLRTTYWIHKANLGMSPEEIRVAPTEILIDPHRKPKE